jgi:hypothetical protein
MIWSENPWTLQPPAVRTNFSLKATVVDKNVFVFTITFVTGGGRFRTLMHRRFHLHSG